jgi:hypothetical protein
MSGLIMRSTTGVGDVWASLLGLIREGSHIILAVAYLGAILGVFRLQIRRGLGKSSAESSRDLWALLVFCLLVQVGEVLESYWSENNLVTAASMSLAVAAAAAAYQRPRWDWIQNWQREAREANRLNEELRKEILERASAARDLADRYDRLKLRVHALEETLRRRTWIQQSREAMNQLNAMLGGCESLLDQSAPGLVPDELDCDACRVESEVDGACSKGLPESC